LLHRQVRSDMRECIANNSQPCELKRTRWLCWRVFAFFSSKMQSSPPPSTDVKWCTVARALIAMGEGGHFPPPYIWTGGRGYTITSVPQIFEQSIQAVFICWFHGILFQQNAYCTLMLTKKLPPQTPLYGSATGSRWGTSVQSPRPPPVSPQPWRQIDTTVQLYTSENFTRINNFFWQNI